MRARLSIQQFELELSGGNARVITCHGEASDPEVRRALRAVGDAIAAPLARRTDVDTSHEAAARAADFVGDHERLIGNAIIAAGDRGACSKEIARATGLTHVQVDRRLGAMGQRGAIKRRYVGDVLLKREGCAVWVKD